MWRTVRSRFPPAIGRRYLFAYVARFGAALRTEAATKEALARRLGRRLCGAAAPRRRLLLLDAPLDRDA